jgi:GTP-binding protein HflX
LKSTKKTVYRERAWLVATVPLRTDLRHTEPLAELESLVETAGARIIGQTIQKLEKPHSRFYLGKGKMEELHLETEANEIDVVIFDHNLTPSQIHNLEKELKRKVIDRTEVILDIFATHARSGPAKLQVELAQLEYNLPRLAKMWTHLTNEQQRGIGMGQRGPGEKQFEVDRRLARRRITDLKRQIEQQQRQKQREVESRSSRNFTVSLVGYTNAGKSTLMNALTEAEVLVDNRLFSTLDTRTRLWNLDGGVPVLLSDTVGFIRHIPHGLVTSFHATLEEVSQADLLLHVVDASHPEREEQIKAVEEVLEELQCGEIPTILIFNKIDRLQDPVEKTLLQNRYPQALILSARTKAGFEDLHPRVADIMTDRFVDIVADIPVTEGRLSAELAGQAMILEKTLIDEHFHMKLKVPRRMAWKLEPYLAPQG